MPSLILWATNSRVEVSYTSPVVYPPQITLRPPTVRLPIPLGSTFWGVSRLRAPGLRTRVPPSHSCPRDPKRHSFVPRKKISLLLLPSFTSFFRAPPVSQPIYRHPPESDTHFFPVPPNTPLRFNLSLVYSPWRAHALSILPSVKIQVAPQFSAPPPLM